MRIINMRVINIRVINMRVINMCVINMHVINMRIPGITPKFIIDYASFIKKTYIYWAYNQNAHY